MKTWNKGMKGLNLGGKKGWFKKGVIPPNTAPVGTEVIVDEGYKETKIAEPNVWKRNHIILWEKENGKVPENYVVVFLDQNKSNITIENLAMIHRRELSMMNKYKLFSEDAEVTLSGIALVRLKETKIAEPNVWKRNHIILWEKENGKVPENYVVVFLDQNKSNITIENLAMIHRRELSMMNKYKLFSEDAEVTLSGIALVRLKDRLNEV